MTLAYVLPFTITLHLAYAGARVTLSLLALNLQASPFTVGILLSLLSLGEVPDLSLLGGFGLILGGVVLVNLADWRAVRSSLPR